ncbi:MAG: glutamate decarboxylase [Desulfotomaculaceae bacterium]|nr:glutamate decarboxylase [Desulfotomaculaceae bacterium]
MWTVVYIAPNKAVAERLKILLATEGFLVDLRMLRFPHVNNASPVEVLVPESEVDEAMEIIKYSMIII